MATVSINDITIGAQTGPLTLIAGPCVIERLDLCRRGKFQVVGATGPELGRDLRPLAGRQLGRMHTELVTKRFRP